MSEDFKRIHENSEKIQVTCTLKNISSYLLGIGKDITLYDLPEIEDNESGYPSSKLREIEEEMVIDIPQEDVQSSEKLNIEQMEAYRKILDRVNSSKGVFFIDGPGGTGKTFLYRALLAYVRNKGMIALATTTSGVAAIIIPGGRTTHSRFSIPLSATTTSVCGISKQSGQVELLCRARLIIWDEAPMAKRLSIETVDISLKDIMSCSAPFGGKVIVFGGDFRQVLPVVPCGTRHESVNASLVKSYVWSNMEVLRLRTNMRARADKEFGEFLLRVGNRDEPTYDDEMIELPEQMVIPDKNDEKGEEALIHVVFPHLIENSISAPYTTIRAILTTTNDYVEKLNEMMIKWFPRESKVFNSFDEAIDDNNNHYQEEFLNILMPNGLPPHKLELKLNCPIFF